VVRLGVTWVLVVLDLRLEPSLLGEGRSLSLSSSCCATEGLRFDGDETISESLLTLCTTRLLFGGDVIGSSSSLSG
jgi:hypothetical protein